MPAPDVALLRERLEAGTHQLGLRLTAGQFDLLVDYLGLLERWNRSFNLTAVRDVQDMVTRHLLDSLSVSPWITQSRIADVGAGAGLPGIPLAIADPSRSVTLIDTNGKKTRFMFQALSTLGLENCEVIHARVERWEPPRQYEAVVSRAFASLSDMIDTCAHLLAPQGRLLAMKGHYPEDELAEVGERAQLLACHPLSVPGLSEERCLLELQPVRGTG